MKKVVVASLILFLMLTFFTIKSIAQSAPASAYKIVAADGAWCWFSDPRAVFHKGLKKRVYYGYINSAGDVLISAMDIKTKAIQTYILHAKLQIDDHNVPAILFLPDGKIMTFYSEHGGRFFIRKSKNAEDISAWEDERTVTFGMKEDDDLCYAHPVMLSGENNRIYMFYRIDTGRKDGLYSSWGQYITYSDDGGMTWTKGQYYLNQKPFNNPIYMKISSDNTTRIDFVFTDGHPKIGPASVYHMYYEKGKFYQTNGNFIADVNHVPLQRENINKVYDVNVTNIKSWIWDIALDRKRRPVITYTQYPAETDHRYHYARWNGKKWLDEELCKAGGMITVLEPGEKVEEAHYSGGVVLDHNNPSNVYLSRQVNGIFEIEHWKRKHNSWKISKITDKSAASNLRPYVVANYPHKNPFVLWMNGLYNHYTRYKTAILINELK